MNQLRNQITKYLIHENNIMNCSRRVCLCTEYLDFSKYTDQITYLHCYNNDLKSSKEYKKYFNTPNQRSIEEICYNDSIKYKNNK